MSGPRAAVLGQPVSHSLSPVLHRAAYAALGLDWTYEAIEVSDRGLAEFLDGLDDSWRGLSLTMPLKRVVLALLDDVSALADATKAVNTVVFTGRRRAGDNTDVHGIVAALSDAGVSGDGLAATHSAAILGGGATATSAVAAVHAMGMGSVTAYVRDRARATDLLEAAVRLGADVTLADWADAAAAGNADVVVAAVPPGAADHLPLVPVRPSAVLLDVVYAPWPTALARRWGAAGGRVVAGLDMLVHQAARQVELMTGHSAPVPAMRAAAAAAVAQRG